MNHCVRLFLLFIPSLIAISLLGVAFSTKWWTIPLQRNIPEENSLDVSSKDVRISSTLIRIPVFRRLISECNAYRNIKVLVSNSFDFREEMSREEQLKLSNENCSSNQFTCRTGLAILRSLTHCINQRQQCDRIIDCEDKSDEISCNENFQISECTNGLTKCPDGKSCYRKDEQTCDGVVNCIDESDERNCNEDKCRLNKHVYCPRENKCARRDNSARCDGIVDCEDNSDEDKCEACNGNSNVILCDSKCFLPKHRCDGTVQCSDFRDELDCDNHPENLYHLDRSCLEQRFNPFHLYPPNLDSSLLDSFTHPTQRSEYVNMLHYLQLVVFYGISGGLVFIFFSMVSLLFFDCCRQKCLSLPFCCYGLWILFACLFICTALLSFVNMWFWKKELVGDYERNLSFEIMIHEKNPSLRNLEFFGLSFWLACGAALTTFIALLLSCFVCCTVGSSRSDDKEYEIMHMQNY